MAVLRQQVNFVEQLYSSGMVDEQEQEQMVEPIEAQERRLARKGAVWRAPKIVEVRSSGRSRVCLVLPKFCLVLALGGHAAGHMELFVVHA